MPAMGTPSVRGKRQPRGLGERDRIIIEALVEIADAGEQQTVRVLPLEAVVLSHRRSVAGVGHLPLVVARHSVPGKISGKTLSGYPASPWRIRFWIVPGTPCRASLRDQATAYATGPESGSGHLTIPRPLPRAPAPPFAICSFAICHFPTLRHAPLPRLARTLERFGPLACCCCSSPAPRSSRASPSPPRTAGSSRSPTSTTSSARTVSSA